MNRFIVNSTCRYAMVIPMVILMLMVGQHPGIRNRIGHANRVGLYP